MRQTTKFTKQGESVYNLTTIKDTNADTFVTNTLNKGLVISKFCKGGKLANKLRQATPRGKCFNKMCALGYKRK